MKQKSGMVCLCVLGLVGFAASGISWLFCLGDYYCIDNEFPILSFNGSATCSWAPAQCCGNTTCICDNLLNRYHCSYSYTVSVTFYISLILIILSVCILPILFQSGYKRKISCCKGNREIFATTRGHLEIQ